MYLSTLEEPSALENIEPQEWIEQAKTYALDYGPPIIAGILVLIIGRWIAKFIVRVVRKILIKRNIDDTLTSFLCSILSMTLMVVVVISGLQTMGIETTSLVAVLGAATLAIGFALQGSLSNFAAGVMLILFKPFKVGDFIEAGGTSGVVEELGVFATLMKTGDNKTIIVPNSSITGGNIVNYSAKDTRRVDLTFGIGYDDDIKQAKQILETVLAKEERILKDPAPTIAVAELADSSVNIVCRPWVKSGDYWGVLFDVTEAVKLAFDEAGISIPFPQTDVHVHKVA